MLFNKPLVKHTYTPSMIIWNYLNVLTLAANAKHLDMQSFHRPQRPLKQNH